MTIYTECVDFVQIGTHSQCAPGTRLAHIRSANIAIAIAIICLATFVLTFSYPACLPALEGLHNNAVT